MTSQDKLQKCYQSLQAKLKILNIDFKPEIALIMGTGLGKLADETLTAVRYQRLIAITADLFLVICKMCR